MKSDSNVMISKPNKDLVEVIQTNQLIIHDIKAIQEVTSLETNDSEPMIVKKKLILDHQFDFHYKHATIEQIHRIINKITLIFEAKKYCSAVFLDGS